MCHLTFKSKIQLCPVNKGSSQGLLLVQTPPLLNRCYLLYLCNWKNVSVSKDGSWQSQGMGVFLHIWNEGPRFLHMETLDRCCC